MSPSVTKTNIDFATRNQTGEQGVRLLTTTNINWKMLWLVLWRMMQQPIVLIERCGSSGKRLVPRSHDTGGRSKNEDVAPNMKCTIRATNYRTRVRQSETSAGREKSWWLPGQFPTVLTAPEYRVSLPKRASTVVARLLATSLKKYSNAHVVYPQ